MTARQTLQRVAGGVAFGVVKECVTGGGGVASWRSEESKGWNTQRSVPFLAQPLQPGWPHFWLTTRPKDVPSERGHR